MASWDAENMRKLVRTLYRQAAQLEIVRECISSAIYRQRYTKFYFKEIKKILGAYTGIRLKSEYITNSLLIENTKEQNDFEYCQTRIGAHIIAAVQSIYSLADIWYTRCIIPLNVIYCALPGMKTNTRRRPYRLFSQKISSTQKLKSFLTLFSDIKNLNNGSSSLTPQTIYS
jgi:hypothetical protein